MQQSKKSAALNALSTLRSACHLECNSHLHDTIPARFHADFTDVGSRIQYIVSCQGPEELRRPGNLGYGRKWLSIRRSSTVGVSLAL